MTDASIHYQAEARHGGALPVGPPAAAAAR